MKVLVFDHCLKVSGHRLHYASLVADSFADTHETILALPEIIQHEPQVESLASRSFSRHFYQVHENTDAVKGFLGSTSRALRARKCLVRLVKHHQPDLVAIPTVDGLAVVAGFLNILPTSAFRKTRVDICVMRGPQNYSNRPLKQWFSDWKWWLVRKGPWQRIMMMDPREWARCDKAIKERILLCPDPVPEQKYIDRHRCRELLNLPSDGRIVVSAGPQNMRKGSDLLLKAFAEAKLNANDYLVMIGRVDPKIVPIIDSLKRQPGFAQRLIVRDEFVSEDEFQMAIVASDVVAIPYRAVDRPSGIVCRSMAWNRPMVMTHRGWLKWILDEFEAGYGANSNDAVELAKVLKQALDHSPTFKTSERANQFIQFNTEKAYLDAWRGGLDPRDNQNAFDLNFLNHQRKA